MTRGALRATHQLKSRLKKGGKMDQAVREEKIGCRERSSNFSLRSTEIGWSYSDRPRFKVGVLDEGYA